ncbi:MAG: type II toxin-antitoxin system VapC family toxin [Candidatus Bipolaricaulia bacterium]
MRLTKVFVDTSAWVALFFPKDRYHQQAKQVWEDLRKERAGIFTSNYIVDEAITYVRKVGGYHLSLELGNMLFASKVLQRVMIGAEEEGRAWALYQKYSDQELSFTDCTSFAVMEKEGIDTAFSFDRDFLKVGLSTVPIGREG